MTPRRLAEAVDLVAGVRAGRRRHPDARRARPADRRRRPAGADQRRTTSRSSSRCRPRKRRGTWLLEVDTGDPAEAGGHAVRATNTRSGRGRWWSCASRSTPRRRARGGGRAGAGHQAAGATPAPAARGWSSRCSRSGRRPAGGWARSPTCRASRRGRGGPGSRCCSSCPSTPRRTSTPAPTPPARRSRSIPSIWRWTPARTSPAAGGRGALPDGMAARIDERVSARRSSTGGAVRELKRAGIALAFERFLRDEWQHAVAARAATVGVHEEQPVLAGRLRAVRGAAREQRRSWLDWPVRAARTRSGRDRRAAPEHGDDLLQREVGCSGSSMLQWRRARREASAARRRAHGRSALHRGAGFGRRLGQPRACSDRDLRVGTPPDDSSPDGQDWGLPVYDWSALARDEFSWIRARASRAGELYSLSTASTTRIGFYRTYVAVARRQGDRFRAGRRVRAAPARRDS